VTLDGTLVAGSDVFVSVGEVTGDGVNVGGMTTGTAVFVAGNSVGDVVGTTKSSSNVGEEVAVVVWSSTTANAVCDAKLLSCTDAEVRSIVGAVTTAIEGDRVMITPATTTNTRTRSATIRMGKIRRCGAAAGERFWILSTPPVSLLTTGKTVVFSSSLT